MLRERSAELRDALESGKLKYDDFQIDQRHDNNYVYVTVALRAEPAFSFSLSASNSGNAASPTIRSGAASFTLTMRPGEAFASEQTTVEGTTAMFAALKSWVRRIDIELTNRPIQREVVRQQKELEALAKEFEALPNEFFTREEADDLKTRLDALEGQLTKNVQQSNAEKKDTDARIAALHAEIAILKERVDALPKKGWSSLLFVRLAKWAADPANRDLIAAGTDVAKKLLGPGNGAP